MFNVRLSDARGHANFGWLDSRHTFSFGQYYDPQHMGVSALRVINDDKVAPGAGFGTHGHSHMEIISLVTEGAMVHKDSEGNEQLLPAGEFQLMSAGNGITHSEFNASTTDPLAFLQIWIQPNERGGQPGYQQKRFDLTLPQTMVITPDGSNGTLQIKQDASLSHINLTATDKLTMGLVEERNYYLHVIQGDISVCGHSLSSGDGIHLSEESELELIRNSDSETTALLFDLP